MCIGNFSVVDYHTLPWPRLDLRDLLSEEYLSKREKYRIPGLLSNTKKNFGQDFIARSRFNNLPTSKLEPLQNRFAIPTIVLPRNRLEIPNNVLVALVR